MRPLNLGAIATGMGATLLLALVATACGGGGGEQGTPTPFTLGGDSRITGVTPTPTAGVPPTRAPKATAPPVQTPGEGQTPSPDGGETAAGRQVFLSAGCTACHTIAGIPQATGKVGPDLTGIGTRAGTRVSGLSAEAYIRQSVLQPGAFVVQGFQNVMPPGLVREGPDLDALVAFLLSQR